MRSLIFAVVGSLLVGWILPWWTVFIVGILAGTLFSKNGWAAFFYSFLGVFVAWAAVAFALDMKNEGLLSNRMAEMFSLPAGSLMILISALIGGLISGIGGSLGFLIRKDYFPRN